MPVTPDIRALIMEGATADRIAEVAKTEGMLTMKQDGVSKALEGTTTLAEVMRVAYGTI
jgi:type IV pilus assembly protein PilB